MARYLHIHLAYVRTDDLIIIRYLTEERIMADMNISRDGQETMKSIQITTSMGLILEAIIDIDGLVTISVYNNTDMLAVASTTTQRLLDGDMLLDPAHALD